MLEIVRCDRRFEMRDYQGQETRCPKTSRVILLHSRFIPPVTAAARKQIKSAKLIDGLIKPYQFAPCPIYHPNIKNLLITIWSVATRRKLTNSRMSRSPIALLNQTALDCCRMSDSSLHKRATTGFEIGNRMQ